MQNKGAIWLFTILLVVACLYEMSFSFFTGGIEQEAKVVATQKLDSLLAATGEDMELGKQDSLRQGFEADYLLSEANEEVVPFIGTTYKRAKEKEINLGLDLQGGMHVTMEVSVPALVRALGSNSANPTFQKALTLAEEKMLGSTDDYVTLFGQSITEIDPNFKLAAVFHNMNNKEKFPRDADNAAIIQIIRLEAEDAVKRTEQVLRKRIDNLGVVQPKIQRLTTSDRIVVELPGIKDPKRVRKILQGTAKLEFWETYDNSDIYELLGELNQVLKVKDSIANLSKQDTAAIAALDGLEEVSAEVEEVVAQEIDSTLNDSDETGNLFSDLASPSDSSSDSTADISQEDVNNPLFEKLVPALNSDENGQLFKVEGPVVGYATVKNIDAVNAYLEGPEAIAIITRTVGRGKIKFLWSAQAFDDNNQFYQLYAIKVGARNAEAPMEGDAVTNARVDTDPLGNPEVTLLMNSTGAKEWAELTAKNVGQNVAIVLDEFVYSAPTVQSEIKGGRSSISGRFSPEEAEDLANVLKAGKLPAPANIIEEAIVGPSLGAEAIQSGLRSFWP